MTIFRSVPPTLGRFAKMLQEQSEGHPNVSGHYPNISEDSRRRRRLLKRILRCFDNTPTLLSTIKGSNMTTTLRDRYHHDEELS